MTIFANEQQKHKRGKTQKHRKRRREREREKGTIVFVFVQNARRTLLCGHPARAAPLEFRFGRVTSLYVSRCTNGERRV